MLIEKNKIYNMDCLEGMKHIPDKSIDMILCDLPYAVTECKWDNLIPLDLLWNEYKRIIKDCRGIVLTSTQPFTTDLINSNREWFKYCWIWNKDKPGFALHAKNMPLKCHEDICIFSNGVINHASKTKKRMVYNPQGLIVINKPKKSREKDSETGHPPRKSLGKPYIQSNSNYPKSIIEIAKENKTLHPTQKPISLFEYLIKTYTQEGDTVLDNCIGSGTTAIAAINTNRNFIGFELNKKYFDIANNRINEVQNGVKY